MSGTLQYRHLGGVFLFQVQAADEFTCVETFLTDTLEGLSLPGGVHQGTAPEATTFPYGAFEYLSALPDKTGYSGDNPVAQLQYRVRIVDQAEAYDGIAAYAAQLKTLLNVANTTRPDGTINSGIRLYPWKQDEVHET